jgi:lia operon protein LiaG
MGNGRKNIFILIIIRKEGESLRKYFLILFAVLGLSFIFLKTIDFSWLPAFHQGTQSVLTKEIEMIEIDVSNVRTEIIPESRKDVKADLEGKGKVIVKRHGDKVEVSVKRKWKWFHSFFFKDKAKLKIYIPENYDRDLSINLGSGELKFYGHSKMKPMKLDELTLDIGSGNVNLKNISVNHFNHNGSSGNVNIDSLTTKTGSFDISSGSLNAKHYIGAIKADLSSGNLHVQMDKLDDNVDIEISSGDVELNLPDNADFTLNGKASSGNITCDFPITSNKFSNKIIKGTHGSGKHQIELTVSSGNIHVY